MIAPPLLAPETFDLASTLAAFENGTLDPARFDQRQRNLMRQEELPLIAAHLLNPQRRQRPSRLSNVIPSLALAAVVGCAQALL